MPPALAELSPTSRASRNRATFPRFTSLPFTWASVTTIRLSTGLIAPTRSATTASFISAPTPWPTPFAPIRASRSSSQRSACTKKFLKNSPNHRSESLKAARKLLPLAGKQPVKQQGSGSPQEHPRTRIQRIAKGGAAPPSEVSERGRVGLGSGHYWLF